MALAITKAASLRPDIKLSQALSGYEGILSAEQKLSYKASPPDPVAVMALTCEVDRKNGDRRTRRYGARLTSFLNSVQGFTGIVDLIIGSIGNPVAGAVWGAVKTAIQIAPSFGTYFDSLSTLLMNIGLNSPRFEKYALLYPTSTSLRKELCNYYAGVVNLCTKIVLFVRKPAVKQIASALRKPFDDEFGTLQKDLIRLGTAVNEEVSLASRQQQQVDSLEGANERKESSLFRATGAVFRRETATGLGQARKWRESRVKSRFLKSCSTYNFETTLNQARKKGASTWIFETEEYQHWRSKGSPSTLLCSGIVGAGKTVLCANVVESLILSKDSEFSLGYFFCKDDEATSLTAREIIGSLARQMFEDIPTDSLSNLDPSIGDFNLNPEQILSHMLLRLPQHKLYVMVIDGLDECEDEEVKLLVELLRVLLKPSNQVFKLFWTGRSNFAVRISEQFRPDFHVHISPSNNGPEISKFIEFALENALETHKLKLRHPENVLRIQDALEAGAREMSVFFELRNLLDSSSSGFRFLWVAFQIDALCAQNTDEDILNSLEYLPKGLPATFRRILQRLQHSNLTNPSLGKKIFEIVAAAKRPLTLNELAEAISITPGDAVWNEGKLVNDVLKSLESCGTFIVVDEELSTVHFAHSSIKRHLLSQPTDLDVRHDVHHYHIGPSQADENLGKIIVTYLSLDVLGTQLSRRSEPSRSYSASVPTFVARSALPKYDVVNKVALAMLRSRRMSGKDAGPDLERSANLVREKNTQMQQVFSFLPYCQKYWLHHTKCVHLDKDQVYKLWERLVSGTVSTVELPWAPECAGELSRVGDLGERFVHWIDEQYHPALIEKATHKLWYGKTHGPTGSDLSYRQLEWLLTLGALTSRDDLPSPKTGGIARLLLEASQRGHQAIVRVALLEGVDVDAKSGTHGNALQTAVSAGNKAIAKLLIEYGADVNLKGSKCGSSLEVAAGTLGMDSIINLLLEKGADVNALGGNHGSPLVAAAATDNVAIMRLLLEAGADVNQSANPNSGDDLVTPLIIAITENNPNTVSILLDAGANVNARDSGASGLLELAASCRNEQIVRQLLNKRCRGKFNYPLKGSLKGVADNLNTTLDIAALLQTHGESMWSKPCSKPHTPIEAHHDT